MNNFEYRRASDTKDAINLIHQKEKSKFLAGGTNLIDLWKYNITNPTS
ncbi:MAG: xanthine dehydrogenase family protein subunit M, partial [Chryseobacterium sp.]